MRSLLVINYFSAAHTARAIESARAASSAPLEVVVVDNSCDSAELEALDSIGADRIIPAAANLGYAGGINLGAAQCSGSRLIVANPDVVFSPRSIDSLCEGAANEVIGPRFVWDDAGEWLLPPAEYPTPTKKRIDSLSVHNDLLQRLRGKHLTRSRLRFWQARERLLQKTLSGAVLSIPRAVFDHVGGFDDRFPLYFEELDFLRRARAIGAAVLMEPRAVCRHLYNQSAGADPGRSWQRFAESERLYFEKWYPGSLRRLRTPPSLEPGSIRDADDPAVELPSGADPMQFVVEASPVPTFTMAVGHFPRAARVALPPDVLQAWRGGTLFLRAVRLRSLTPAVTVAWSP